MTENDDKKYKISIIFTQFGKIEKKIEKWRMNNEKKKRKKGKKRKKKRIEKIQKIQNSD